MLLDIPRRLTGHGLNRFLTSGLLLYGKEKKLSHICYSYVKLFIIRCFFFSIEIQTNVNLKDMKT